MQDTVTKTATEIREFREQNPKMRERDLANKLSIKEAQLVAAYCGHGNKRLKVEMDATFKGLAEVGEVLALTRNESAVHEKSGVYDNYIPGKHATMMLGEAIDTRMFPKHFVHAFLVQKKIENGIRQSIQFFDGQGDAVHKIHTKESTDLAAWDALVISLIHDDQSDTLTCEPPLETAYISDPVSVLPNLRRRWENMTDTHQFMMFTRKLKLSRHQAISIIGDDLAWQIEPSAVEAMLRNSANNELPIMCFVGSQGCIQIHSGPIENIKTMGPWLNIMDKNFHLHLRNDHITQAWIVRKPSDKGHVTSLEAYNEKNELIIQFFGKRIEGQDEREIWRSILENLPRLNASKAA